MAVQSPCSSLPQFPSRPLGLRRSSGARVRATDGVQEVRGRRNPAHPGLIRTSAPGTNQRRGRGPDLRVPSRTRLAVGPAVAAASMSSTQFNKGPSYGLSAEVKNRVSEGRPQSGPRRSCTLGLLLGWAPRQAPRHLGRSGSETWDDSVPPSPQHLRFWGRPPRLPQLWGSSEVCDLALPQRLGVVGSDPFPSLPLSEPHGPPWALPALEGLRIT